MHLSFLKTFLAIFVLMFVFSCGDDEEKTVFTIIVDSNGGTNFAPINVKLGGTIPQNKLYPPPIIDDGGVFEYWCSDEELYDEYDFNTPVTNDMILYAKWFYVIYTVSFEMNGADAIPNIEIKEGHSVGKIEKPEYKGNTFVNWYEDPEFTKPFNPLGKVTNDITLYARWVKKSPSDWFTIDDNGMLLSCTPPEGTTVINMPDEVKIIPSQFVIQNNLRLIKEFILPDSLEEIRLEAFRDAGITSVTIPPKVKVLEALSFNNCKQLSSITFTENSQLEKLETHPENQAVISSESLIEISFPPSLQYIGKYVLKDNPNLETVTFERDKSPVIFYDVAPSGVWLFGPGKWPTIRVPEVVKKSFLSEMRKVMKDFEYNNMSKNTVGY